MFDISKETGNKILKSRYLKGIPHGKHTEWYESGKKKFEGTQKDGEVISQKWWNEDGSRN